MSLHKLHPALLVSLGVLSPMSFALTTDLSTLSWTLKNQNGSIAIPATLPSQVHMDLKSAGLITEPLLGINGECKTITAFAL